MPTTQKCLHVLIVVLESETSGIFRIVLTFISYITLRTKKGVTKITSNHLQKEFLLHAQHKTRIYFW